jgi:WD40 repeat protein
MMKKLGGGNAEFSPDGKWIVVPNGHWVAGGGNAVFSPDGRWIATGRPDGTLHLWDAKSLVEKAVVKGSINGSPLTEVRFSRSGKLIVTVGMGIVPGFTALQKKVRADDTVVRVWRVNMPE